MRFWEWLTSVNGLPVLVALISVIGTVVAVAATIITQMLVAKRARQQETARFNWERERYAAELKAAEASRFENVKREAFAAYLNSLAPNISTITLSKNHPWVLFFHRRLWRQRLIAAGDEHVRCLTQIRLLAPEVHRETMAVAEALEAASSKILRGESGDIDSDSITDLIKTTRIAMQRSLGIEPESQSSTIEQNRSVTHTKPELNEAPMSGDAKPHKT